MMQETTGDNYKISPIIVEPIDLLPLTESTSSQNSPPNNEPIIAQIKLQITDLECFKSILIAKNYKEYIEKYKELQAWLSSRDYAQAQYVELDMLFDYFDFWQNDYDPRTQKMHEILQELQQTRPNDARLMNLLHNLRESASSATLFHLFYFTIQEIQHKESVNLYLCRQMQELLNLQINKLQDRLENLLPPPPNLPETQPHQQSQEPPFPVIPNSPHPMSLNGALAIVGSSLVGACVLLNLSPQFALLLGIHLSPAMFVILVLAGSSMAIYGISRKDPNDSPRPGGNPPQQAQESSIFSLKFWKSGCGFWPIEKQQNDGAAFGNNAAVVTQQIKR
ncbi:MAG: hypothetical protein ACO1N3_00550 [Gammaproteobacteria bacterium]